MANCGILLNDGTSFLQINSGDFFLLNDSSCSAEPGAGAAVGPQGGGRKPVGPSYWDQLEEYWAWLRNERRKQKATKKKTKKRELVDELDEALEELHARVAEQPVEERPTLAWLPEMGRFQLESNNALLAEVSAAELRAQIAVVHAIMQEMDDEETILLALH